MRFTSVEGANTTEVNYDLYKKTDELKKNNNLSNPEASLIHYVFAIQKVLQNPEKYKTKLCTVIQRDLYSFEEDLISSVNDNGINFAALNKCKDHYKSTYKEFI